MDMETKYIATEPNSDVSQRELNMLNHGEAFINRPQYDAEEAFRRLNVLKKTFYDYQFEVNKAGTRSMSVELVELYETLYDTFKKIEKEEISLITEGR